MLPRSVTWFRVPGSLITRIERAPITPTERVLIDAVIADPDDDGPRLVYADWLCGRPEPELAARGELIVVQCALEHLADPAEHNRLKARDFELVERYGNAWCAHVGLGSVRNNWYESDIEAEFRRGFIESASSWTSDYAHLAGQLFRNEPVRALALFGEDPRVLARLPESVHLRRLRGLGLRSMRMTATALAAIIGSEHAADLERVELAHTDIAGGIATITVGCGLSKLRELALPYNRIDDAGAAALASWNRASQLEVLVLDHNPIGDVGARALLQSRYLTRLRRLSLAGVAISSTLRAQLVERFASAIEL